MISPIKTIITNNSKTAVRFRISSRLAVAMTPAGSNGDVVKLTGDIFTLLDSDRSATYVLSMIKSGAITISYTVDKLFGISEGDAVNMNVPTGDVCDWYNAKCKSAAKAVEIKPTEQKPAETKVAEPVKTAKTEPAKQSAIAAQKVEPAKTEESKVAEPAKPTEVKKSEAAKAEQAVNKDEATKQEEAKSESESKQEPAKGGRKIKVQ